MKINIKKWLNKKRIKDLKKIKINSKTIVSVLFVFVFVIFLVTYCSESSKPSKFFYSAEQISDLVKNIRIYYIDKPDARGLNTDRKSVV